MNLRIHYFQHVPFEGVGCIQDWIFHHGYSLSSTRFFENEPIPSVTEYDWLVVMGGPMGANDHDLYPWLTEEKRAIRDAIENGKTVIGICLGAQLIASVLGAKVAPSFRREIGWFNIALTSKGKEHPVFQDFPASMRVLQWHDDAFDIPEGAVHLASSEACNNQAFIWGNKVLGLQFHFEVTREGLDKMLEDEDEEIDTGDKGQDNVYVEDPSSSNLTAEGNPPDLKADQIPPDLGYVQNKTRILSESGLIDETNTKMFQLLDRLLAFTKT